MQRHRDRAKYQYRGEYVRAASEGSARPALTVTDAERIRVVVQVPDREVPVLDVGDPAKVNLSAISDDV